MCVHECVHACVFAQYQTFPKLKYWAVAVVKWQRYWELPHKDVPVVACMPLCMGQQKKWSQKAFVWKHPYLELLLATENGKE